MKILLLLLLSVSVHANFESTGKEFFKAKYSPKIADGSYRAICKSSTLKDVGYEFNGYLTKKDKTLEIKKFEHVQEPTFESALLSPSAKEKMNFTKSGFELKSSSQDFDYMSYYLRQMKNGNIIIENVITTASAGFYQEAICNNKCNWGYSLVDNNNLVLSYITCSLTKEL